MRLLLALLFSCLVGCMATPPAPNGVLNNGVCEMRWEASDFPLDVVVDNRLSTERVGALEAAIDSWNLTIGSTVFQIARGIEWYDTELVSPSPATVYVLLMDLPDLSADDTLQGWASVSASMCRIHHAYVLFDVAVPIADAMLVFKHELGHTLGLDHDENPLSIMWHYAASSYGIVMPDDVDFVRSEIHDN